LEDFFNREQGIGVEPSSSEVAAVLCHFATGETVDNIIETKSVRYVNRWAGCLVHIISKILGGDETNTKDSNTISMNKIDLPESMFKHAKEHGYKGDK